MAIIFTDGFESHRPASDSVDEQVNRKYASVSGSDQDGTLTGRFRGNAASSFSMIRVTQTFTERDTWTIHWAQRFQTSVSGSVIFAGIDIRRGGTEQLRIQARRATGDPSIADGALYFMDIKRGATTLASAGPYEATKWYVMQLQVTIDPTTGAYEFRTNRWTNRGYSGFTVDASGSGANTADTGVAGADSFGLHWESSGSIFQLDDLIIMDDTGSVNNDFFSDPRSVFQMRPDADGADLDWDIVGAANTWTALEDAPGTSGGDADKITSDTPGQISLVSLFDPDNGFPFQIRDDIPIDGVVAESIVSMETTGTRTVRHIYRNAADSRSAGTSKVLSTTAPVYFQQVWETNPIAASAWTLTDLREMQLGFELVS